MPVPEMFFLRKLWFYVFNIHGIGKQKSVFYTYTEGTIKRGPYEVCNFLFDYFNTILEKVKKLHVFNDTCGGQNRNFMNNRFSDNHQYFPVRGYIFLPCDRNFSVIKRSVRRFDRIYVTRQYEDPIKTAKKHLPK
jgi:hypothetical protein